MFNSQWSIVYDVTNKNIFYKTQWNDEIKVLSFSKICYPLDTLSYQYINLRTGNKFQKLTTSINIEYLNELEMYILNQQKNDNSDLVNKINLYLK